MMQPLDGSPLSNAQDLVAQQFLGDYIDKAVANLKNIRVPPSFEQTVNGQTPLNLQSHPEYFS